MSFLDGGSFSLVRDERFERLQEPFRIRTDAEIGVGDYAFHETRASYRSSAGRSLSGWIGISGSSFFDGSRTSVEGGLTWRADHHLAVEVSAVRNRVVLPATRFTADVYGTRIDYGLSTTLFASAFVQYNADAEQVVTNVRVNFIHSPLSDFFLVYTESRDTSGIGGVLERRMTAKVTKLLPF